MTGLFTTMLSADVSGGGVTGAVGEAVSLFSKVWDLIVGNPILMIFIGMAVLSGGVVLFRKVFKSVRH